MSARPQKHGDPFMALHLHHLPDTLAVSARDKSLTMTAALKWGRNEERVTNIVRSVTTHSNSLQIWLHTAHPALITLLKINILLTVEL